MARDKITAHDVNETARAVTEATKTSFYNTAHAEGDDSSEAPVPKLPSDRIGYVSPDPPPVEPEWAPAAMQTTVLLLCDHVYLPADPMADDWSAAQVTIRYAGKTADGKRTRVSVSPSLAAFLQERGQAEIL